MIQIKRDTQRKTYVISDLHLNHGNIISHCSRPFKSLREMNHTLISNWNSVVGVNDYVYFLGDLAFGNGDKFVDSLNGRIYFIWGNHDKTANPELNHASIFKVIDGIPLLFIHDSAMVPKDYHGWVIHGHNHNNNPKIFPFFDPDRKRVNVCVEMINYYPIELSYIIKLIQTCNVKITYCPKKQVVPL